MTPFMLLLNKEMKIIIAGFWAPVIPATVDREKEAPQCRTMLCRPTPTLRSGTKTGAQAPTAAVIDYKARKIDTDYNTSFN